MLPVTVGEVRRTERGIPLTFGAVTFGAVRGEQQLAALGVARERRLEAQRLNESDELTEVDLAEAVAHVGHDADSTLRDRRADGVFGRAIIERTVP